MDKKCRNCGGIIPIYINKYKRRKFCSPKCKDDFKRLGGYCPKRKIKTFFILERDNFRCVYCGKSSIEDGVKLEVDHLVPSSITNLELIDEKDDMLVTSCSECNHQKSDSILSDDVMKRIIDRNRNIRLIPPRRYP